MKKVFIFLLICFGNAWIWKIFEKNFLLGVLCIVASLSLFSLLISTKPRKNLLIISSLSLVVIASFQIKWFDPNSFVDTTPLEKDLMEKRMRLYPNPRIAHWLEQRQELIAFYRFRNNLGEALDFNYYFFANHPRERVGVTEHEKFSPVLFPLLLVGLYLSIKTGKHLGFYLLFIFILFTSAATYTNEPVGFALVFPFIVSLSILALNKYVK